MMVYINNKVNKVVFWVTTSRQTRINVFPVLNSVNAPLTDLVNELKRLLQ
jgi:hypothetical protein